MRGEIDMLYEVAPDALDFIEQSSNTQVRSFLRPFVFTMGLNVKHPVLADRDVRRALNMAVNRTEIIKRVFRDHAYPATDHVWPRHWAYDHELPRLRYDPEKAIELLEAKGLRIPPADARERGRAQRHAEPLPLHLPDPRRRHAVRAHGPAAPASARRGRHRHAHRSAADRRDHAAPADRPVRRVPPRHDLQARPRQRLSVRGTRPKAAAKLVRHGVYGRRWGARQIEGRAHGGRDASGGAIAAAGDARRSAGGLPALVAYGPRRQRALPRAADARPRHHRDAAAVDAGLSAGRSGRESAAVAAVAVDPPSSP